jgi:hypothetical protein
MEKPKKYFLPMYSKTKAPKEFGLTISPKNKIQLG